MQEVKPPEFSELTYIPENNNIWDEIQFHDWLFISSVTLFILGIFIFKKDRIVFITSFFSLFLFFCINNILTIAVYNFYDPQWYRFKIDFKEIFYSYGSMILAYPISLIYALLQVRIKNYHHKKNIILYTLPILFFLVREYIFFHHLIPVVEHTYYVSMRNDSPYYFIFQLSSINHWFPIWYSGMFEHEFLIFYNYQLFYLMEVIVTPIHLALIIFICQIVNKMTAFTLFIDNNKL